MPGCAPELAWPGTATRDNEPVQPSSYASGALPVGDAARPLTGRAVRGSLLAALVFLTVTWAGKGLPALYAHEPWQDDPYDAVVSFSMWCVPLLLGLGALRIALCRRLEPLPLRRAVDVVRWSRVTLAVALVTLGSEWVSVALHDRGRTWDGTTALLVVALAAATALAAAAARDVHRALRALRRSGQVPAEPDWLDDLVDLGERAVVLLGRWRGPGLRAVRWADRELLARVRRRPLVAVGAFSLVFGVGVSAPQVVLEQYAWTMALFYVSVTACSVFAFVVVAGAHLRLVSPSESAPGTAVRSFVAACASVPLAVGFRGSLWWVVGTDGRAAGLGDLALLVSITAVVTFVVVAIAAARPRTCHCSAPRAGKSST